MSTHTHTHNSNYFNIFCPKLLFAFVLTLSFVVKAFSQDNNATLFEEATRLSLNLSNIQDQKLDKMISNSIYQSHHFIEFNSISQIQQDGVLQIKLPDTE